MAISPKCSTDSLQKQQEKEKKETRSLYTHTYYKHRDTGPSPVTSAPLPLRVTRSYFSDNYGDVINHCNKLSSYDE